MNIEKQGLSERNASVMPEMYSLRKTAEKSGLSIYYLRKLLAEGRVKYLQCGKKFLVNYQSVIDLCNGAETVKECEGVN